MNEQNLIPVSSRTPSELREQTRKGGIASGEARRERKAMREWLDRIGEEEITNDPTGEKMPRVAVAALRLMDKMCKGDLKAIRLYAEITGQLKPRVEIEACPPPIIADIFACRG